MGIWVKISLKLVTMDPIGNKTASVLIESIKTTSLENVNTGVLEKIKNNIQEVKIKPKMTWRFTVIIWNK